MVNTALDRNLDVLTAKCAEAGGSGRPPATNLTAEPPALPTSAFDAWPFSHSTFSPSCEKLLVSSEVSLCLFAQSLAKINQSTPHPLPPPTD